MNPNTQGTAAPQVHSPSVKKRASESTSTTVSQRFRSFERYLRIIQKEIHPSCKISAASLNALNSMVMALFKTIAGEARELAQKQKRATLMARDIEFACRLVLPQELEKDVLIAGDTALTKYKDTVKREAAEHHGR